METVIRNCEREIMGRLFPVTEGRQEAVFDRKAVTLSIRKRALVLDKLSGFLSTPPSSGNLFSFLTLSTGEES